MLGLAGALSAAAAAALFAAASPSDAGAAPPAAASDRAGTAGLDAAEAAAALSRIAAKRAAFSKALGAARGEARGDVRRDAARYLEQALIDTVLPRWDGTPWSFSGTSTTPGEGSIACGYFVSTTLGEAGLRVERARLAQQPAEDIIKTLVPPTAIARFSNVPADEFAAAVARRGDGLYIVGLDIHVGFLIVRSNEVLFHHASYVGPARVVREPATASAPLVASKYRVIGKLFTDDALIDAWLSEAPIPTKTRAPAGRPRSRESGRRGQ